MVNLWTRGGLSWRELAVRTWRESWEDAVFGQAARLAFYHFLAIFPSLLLFFFLLVRFPTAGAALRSALATALNGLLPRQAAALMQTMIENLNATAAAGRGVFSAAVGTVWAAVNGTWAVVKGLNIAYEVKERRSIWRAMSVALALTMALAFMFGIALVVTAYGAHAVQIVTHQGDGNAWLAFLLRFIQWPVLVVLLLASFALFYRFGPNLYNRQWQWSTPGAVLALILWLLATGLVRLYFEHFHSYHVVYGPLEGVATLLLWFYFTSAAILIGGEMNSEIEKAADQDSTGKERSGHAREAS